jgi:hypothetical protein
MKKSSSERPAASPRISLVGAERTTRPLWIMMTRSQSVSTSESSCELKKTVRPRAFLFGDDLTEVEAAEGVEARRQFVEDEQVGVGDERLRDADALLHALGEVAQEVFGASIEADAGQEAGDFLAELRLGEAGEAAVQLEEFPRLEEGVIHGHFGQVADALAAFGGAGLVSEDPDGARRRENEAHQGLEGGALPGAVRADEPDAFPRGHREADPVHGPGDASPAPVFAHQIHDLDHVTKAAMAAE